MEAVPTNEDTNAESKCRSEDPNLPIAVCHASGKSEPKSKPLPERSHHRKSTWKNSICQNHWKLSSRRCTQLCWGLSFYGHLPFWPQGPSCLRSNLMAGLRFLPNALPVCLAEKALPDPATWAPKLSGLRLHFDFSSLGAQLKIPFVLARKLEEIKCNTGEWTSY